MNLGNILISERLLYDDEMMTLSPKMTKKQIVHFLKLTGCYSGCFYYYLFIIRFLFIYLVYIII